MERLHNTGFSFIKDCSEDFLKFLRKNSFLFCTFSCPEGSGSGLQILDRIQIILTRIHYNVTAQSTFELKLTSGSEEAFVANAD